MNPALSCKTNKLTKWASHPKFNCATSRIKDAARKCDLIYSI